ncbi:hypothetical protein SynRS9902_03009 [Synechococcus sp. RS9902]|nr:hypothetical protein SynRS9902_03009 [Synechococcus sp. RS9902]
MHQRTSAPFRGLFYGRKTKPTDKAAAEDARKPCQHAVENKRELSTRLSRGFSTGCEEVENKASLPIL